MSTITDDTATITDDLASLLAKARRPGDFHVSGVVETFPPGLSVEGVGEIALPLLPFQAEQLVAAASAAARKRSMIPTCGAPGRSSRDR
jgi:hypothetical protein